VVATITNDHSPDIDEVEREALHRSNSARSGSGVPTVTGSGSTTRGHAVDHFARAGGQLRAPDHRERVDALRCEVLSKGAVDDRWTYDLLESFGKSFLSGLADFESGPADGRRRRAPRYRAPAGARVAQADATGRRETRPPRGRRRRG